MWTVWWRLAGVWCGCCVWTVVVVKGGTVTNMVWVRMCVQTPLHLSARHYSERYLPITLMLIECGANVTLEDRDGKTPGQVRLHNSVCLRMRAAREVRSVNTP